MLENQQAGPQIPVASSSNQATKAPSRGGFPWLAIIITLFVTAIIVILAGYFFFLRGGDEEKTNLTNQVSALETERNTCGSQLDGCRDSLTSLQNDVDRIDEEAKMMVELPYKGWDEHIDSELGLVWKHPKIWSVLDNKIAAEDNNDKEAFCVSFSSAISGDVVLNICYRLKSDLETTTWVHEALLYDKLAVVEADVTMLDRGITEKTLFGEDGKVMTIVYAQNIKDDETGYPARVAVGDYYITATADYLGEGEVGITPGNQKTLDMILSTLSLPQEVIEE